MRGANVLETERLRNGNELNVFRLTAGRDGCRGHALADVREVRGDALVEIQEKVGARFRAPGFPVT
jgi:hypothetical protein